MMFDNLLSNILDIADFPQDKRQEFRDVFYRNYLDKLIDEINIMDPQASQKLQNASLSEDPELLGEVLKDMSNNTLIKEKISKVNNEVTNELVEDIVDSSSAEQKQKILALLPNPQQINVV